LARGGRLLVELKDESLLAEETLRQFAPRGVVRTGAGRWQILLGGEAQRLASEITA
jgi:phosphotransferase system IIB component